MKINKIPPLQGGVLALKRVHFLTYDRIDFNTSYKIDKPSKLVNVMPYLGIFYTFFLTTKLSCDDIIRQIQPF